ncbi:thioredoxin domain-containing protein [Adhaeretor mobilis]|uniref:hypothetical protein n=1 Tax=Adhaeretor mobilis TaxID=1930276 RepID=UPI0011A5AE09|nr:hypothetical protein [Adhaeretor mobilis]
METIHLGYFLQATLLLSNKTLVRLVVAMRTILLTSIIVCGTIFLTFRFEEQLQTAAATILPSSRATTQDFDWPPKLNETYPDFQLIDQEGTPTRLSEFKGKIILLEPIGMPCKACQAFSGGHERGGFRDIPPQPGLPSIEEAARKYGGFDLSDDRIVKIRLLLYSLAMRAPTAEDARAWAEHFGLERAKNEIVLAGLPSMIGDASYRMIPGLQLIDQEMVLRADGTGRSHQQHDLYRELLPGVRKMLEGEAPF